MLTRKGYPLFLCLFLAVTALAAPLDLAGEWNAKVEAPQDTVTYAFKFDVKDDSFTGAVKITNKKEEATGQITDGKIDGNKISFIVRIPIDNSHGHGFCKRNGFG